MRVIEVFDEPVRAIAVSPDGRFVAAAAGFDIVTFDWLSGAEALRVESRVPVDQLAFTPDGNWAIFASPGGLFRLPTRPGGVPERISVDSFSGGVAVSPDGRTLAATPAGRSQQVTLQIWELPAWRLGVGVEYWSPFTRLAFSPNGEHIGGINSDVFELRFRQSGGLNRREESPWEQYRRVQERAGRRFRRTEPAREAVPSRAAYLSFARDNETVVCGWDLELRVMETRAGGLLKRLSPPGKPFADATFLGSGRLLATVDNTPAVRFWSAESWEVVREYDWGAGGLTCVAATADGLAGVCGTAEGRLVVFDVDE
jgi:WD40 repeat protein